MMRLLFPCRTHGPFCTGGPMHSPFVPVGPIERFVARFFPPHSMAEANRLYAEHIRAIGGAMHKFKSGTPAYLCWQCGAPEGASQHFVPSTDAPE